MTSGDDSTPDGGEAAAGTSRMPLSALAWLWVGLPMAYGIYELTQKAAQLFTG
ncbi:MAG: MFS transporter small subunit [Streptomyces sp.]|uniref:MFS transporter small subunit n=1 Tax=Streptomyces sp. TaxID=1931 RepID=UPI003D6AE0CB